MKQGSLVMVLTIALWLLPLTPTDAKTKQVGIGFRLGDDDGVAASAHSFTAPSGDSVPSVNSGGSASSAKTAGPLCEPWALPGGTNCTFLALSPVRLTAPIQQNVRANGSNAPATVASISPEQLARVATDRAMALAADPRLEIAPGRVGLTGLESYFWLAEEPAPIIATATAGGLAVTAEARPVQYIWDFDDGAEHVTSHTGRHWSRRRGGNISHLYETKGLYELSVEVVWHARWRIGGGSYQSLGYFSTSDSRPYPVREIISVLVRPS